MRRGVGAVKGVVVVFGQIVSTEACHRAGRPWFRKRQHTTTPRQSWEERDSLRVPISRLASGKKIEDFSLILI